MPEFGETRRRLPTGSLPLDQTQWSGDHEILKAGICARATDNVFIDLDGNAWLENPDGTFGNCGEAQSYINSNAPKGRSGKDRNPSRR